MKQFVPQMCGCNPNAATRMRPPFCGWDKMAATFGTAMWPREKGSHISSLEGLTALQKVSEKKGIWLGGVEIRSGRTWWEWEKVYENPRHGKWSMERQWWGRPWKGQGRHARACTRTPRGSPVQKAPHTPHSKLHVLFVYVSHGTGMGWGDFSLGDTFHLTTTMQYDHNSRGLPILL